MNDITNIHFLTHVALADLNQAFIESKCQTMEGLILRALVAVRQLHDQLPCVDQASMDIDAEEYCCAV